jgi:hypothetical protein
MICPQTKEYCDHYFCKTDGCIMVDEKVPPPPTLAEIERLVDALVDAAIYSDVPDAQEARAALMAAIRLYVQE